MERRRSYVLQATVGWEEEGERWWGSPKVSWCLHFVWVWNQFVCVCVSAAGCTSSPVRERSKAHTRAKGTPRSLRHTIAGYGIAVIHKDELCM